ncbi:hypothetical protein C823_000915 [Eubacterium plexicaudatum ASF492]|nr:hypothetical protein C823_000915 [Eubacterium plexicaudatum ASF492]
MPVNMEDYIRLLETMVEQQKCRYSPRTHASWSRSRP